MSCSICSRPDPVDPMRPYLDQTLVTCRACWVEEDRRSEALELEFGGELLFPYEPPQPARARPQPAAPPVAHPAPVASSPAPRRRAGRPVQSVKLDTDGEPSGIRRARSSTIEAARRKLAARGIHVETA